MTDDENGTCSIKSLRSTLESSPINNQKQRHHSLHQSQKVHHTQPLPHMNISQNRTNNSSKLKS